MSRNKPHSNYVVIIQSSGTSKSRMVHEQAKLVFTIPFNLRDPAEKRGKSFPSFDHELRVLTLLLALAFPDPDEDIRTYLLRYAAHFDVFDVQAYYLTFLGVLFIYPGLP